MGCLPRLRDIDKDTFKKYEEYIPGRFARRAEHFFSENERAIKVVNDHTDSNDNRLGAVADIRFVLDAENIDEDILVMAGDNLFEFDLCDFEAFYCRMYMYINSKG